MGLILAVENTLELSTRTKQHFFHSLDPEAFLARTNCIVAERQYLERSLRYKQLIPYVMIISEDLTKVLSYKRAVSGGEERLHDLYSVGFGGHIEIQDIILTDGSIDLKKTIYENIHRELEEELSYVPNVDDLKFMGVINNNTNSVNQVHLGLCYTIIDDNALKSVEKDLEDVQYRSFADIRSKELEEWSVSVIKAYLHEK